MNRIVRLVTGLAILLTAAAALLVWRLDQGPIALDFLTPYVERSLAAEDGPYRITVRRLDIVWTGRRPEVLAQDAELRGADGALIAVLPAVKATMSLRALGRGRIAPSSVEARGLALVLRRGPDGAVSLTRVGDEAVTTPAAPMDGLDLAHLVDRFDAIEAAAYLRRLSLTEATVAIDDAILGERWLMPTSVLEASRGRDGRLLATMRTRVLIDGAEKHLRLDAAYDRDTRRIAGEAGFYGIQPSALAGLSPELAPLRRFAVPLSGRIGIEADPDLVPDRVTFIVQSTGGSIALGDTPDQVLRVEGLLAEGTVVGALDRVELGHVGLMVDGATTTLQGTVSRAERGYEARLGFADLRPDAFARALPAAEGASGAAVSLDGELALDIDTDGRVAAAALTLESGGGSLDLPGLYADPLEVSGISGSVTWDAGSDTAVLDGLAVVVDGVAAEIGARLEPEAEGRRATVTLHVPTVEIDRALALWPRTVAEGGREWVFENMSGGAARDVRFDLDLRLDETLALVASEATGGFEASGVTLRYWEPMPSITDVEGRAVFAGDRITIDITGGRSSGVRVRGGRLSFTDLGEDTEWLEITADLEGALADVLATLDRPPLHYAEFLGLDPAAVEGTAAGQLRVRLPLLDDLDFDQIDIESEVEARDAVIPGAVFDDPLSGADLRARVDKTRLELEGAARLRNRPVTILALVELDGERPLERFRLRGPVDAAALGDWDLDFFPIGGGRLDGVVAMDVTSEQRRGEAQVLTLRYDLSEARLAVPELQWAKPAGETAVGEAEVRIRNDQVLAVPRFTLSGGGLSVDGAARFSEDGSVTGVDLDRLQLADRYDLGGSVALPEPDLIEILLGGALLDVRPFLGISVPEWEDGDAGPGVEALGEATRVRVRIPEPIGSVLVGSAEPVRDVRGEIAIDRDERIAGGVEGMVNGAAVRLDVAPGERSDTITLEAADAGALLRALGVSERVEGGTVELKAERSIDRDDGPIEGRFVMRDFRVGDVPILMQVLSTASITGPLALLTAGQRLDFTELEMPFVKKGDVVELPPGRAYGAALGITFQGGFDLDSSTMDLVGTIVPSYAINRVLGAIPILGFLLTGGEGEGVFAATYRATGPLEDPQVRVNPLTALAPGFLRSLFGPLLGAETGTRFDPETDPALGGQ